ncbi:MAG TPA: GDSL-type esterase/lipase family protein [Fimbriimonas sp.]|nr:GDSL-type esterase/lipase family protein [Fimbriimonas sp.]
MRFKWLAVAGLFLSIPFVSLAQQGPSTPTPTTQPLSVTPVVDDAPTKAKSYDWIARHQAVLDRIKKGPVDLILIGDSITHGWGGDPQGGGPSDLWDHYYKGRNTVNLGFGWDRTEHVIWRLENGEIDHIHPKVAVIMIGTNNLWRDSVDDIALGVSKIINLVKKSSRRTKILLLGVFPRDHEPNTDNRKKIVDLNQKLAGFTKIRGVTFLDIGSKFLADDGTISADIMPDFLHPNHKGYEIWAAAMEPTLSKLMGDQEIQPLVP